MQREAWNAAGEVKAAHLLAEAGLLLLSVEGGSEPLTLLVCCGLHGSHLRPCDCLDHIDLLL